MAEGYPTIPRSIYSFIFLWIYLLKMTEYDIDIPDEFHVLEYELA